MPFQKISCFVLMFLSFLGNSQTTIAIQDHQVQKFKNSRAIYSDHQGKFFGAGNSIDAETIVVVFKDFFFDKKSNLIKMKGVTYQTLAENPLRLNGTKIFIATPNRNHLRDIKLCGYSKTSKTRDGTDGDFDITFKAEKNYRLYFEGGKSSYLLEYDIWKLIKQLK